jgi:hypothetical protein
MYTLTVKRAARIAAATLFVLVVTGCGGGGNDSAPPPPPPPAGNVGPAGATVTSPDNNASLDVPAGALSSTINVTLTPATDGFQSDLQPAGRRWQWALLDRAELDPRADDGSGWRQELRGLGGRDGESLNWGKRPAPELQNEFSSLAAAQPAVKQRSGRH